MSRLLLILLDYHNGLKSNLSLNSIYYAVVCNDFAGPISASLRPGNTAFFEEILWLQAVGNTVSNLTGPKFEPPNSRSKNEHLSALPVIF